MKGTFETNDGTMIVLEKVKTVGKIEVFKRTHRLDQPDRQYQFKVNMDDGLYIIVANEIEEETVKEREAITKLLREYWEA